MSITYNDLIARAQQVRDESEVGANTATRVGQLLTDIIQWCQDNNADLGDYLLNFTAHLNERGGILNWFQSRIVLLKTMGSGYDDVSVGSLSDGDVYYDSKGNWIFEKSGSSAINGIHPSKGVFYVNLANKTAYQWDGTTFQVAIEGSSGGGASTVTAFEGYEVIESVAELPEQGSPTTGYIVGTHIYAYVGENGDTADGAYQDLGDLGVDPDIYQPRLIAGTGISIASDGKTVSVDAEVVQPVTPDGTFDIRIGTNTYTINLNHTHEHMAKLVVCEESDLPSTLDNSTIYAITDSGETEIEKLIIRGMEFAGGGVPDTGEPMISSPSNGSTINLGTNEGSGVSKTITVKGKNLTGDLTVAVGTGLTISYGQTLNGSSVTIPMAQALLGAQVTIAYSGTGALDDGSLVISHDGSVLSSVVVVVVVPVPTTLTAIKMTGTQWLQTDYKPNANTEFELDVKISGFSSSSSGSGQIMFDCAMNTIADTAKLFRMYYTSGTNAGIKFANEESITNPNTNSIQDVSNAAVNGIRGIIKYIKESGHGTFSCGSSSVETTLKSSTMENALKIGHGRTSNAGADAISDFTEFIIYGFVITENGTTVRNYVPAELDGEAGLYDTITGAFHTSATSSSIIGIE